MTEKRKERGEIIEDEEGTKWWVLGSYTMNGKSHYSKVKVGSLAAKISGFETDEGKITK